MRLMEKYCVGDVDCVGDIDDDDDDDDDYDGGGGGDDDHDDHDDDDDGVDEDPEKMV